MPIPTSPGPWWGSLLWLATVAISAFGIAWLTGTRLHLRKGPYIPLLLAMTVGFGIGYLRWLDVDLADVLSARWPWGIAAGLLIGVGLAGQARRQPVDRPIEGTRRAIALVWEGAVYGTAEGLLLSAIPPFMAWQMVDALGWSGWVGGVARWTIPIVAGAVVIVVHHLGYWSCRNRILVPITLGLSVLSLGFLVTGSWLTPVIAHIVLHSVLIVHGSEMPPHDRSRERMAAAPVALGRAA